MLFNSIGFLLFFPVVSIVYFLIGQKYRWVWLLGASYYFYMNWKPGYALLILFSTITTYGLSLLIDDGVKASAKKWVPIGGLLMAIAGWLFAVRGYFFLELKFTFLPVFLFVLLFTVGVVGLFATMSKGAKNKKIALVFGLTLNLLILFFYKYFNFAGGLITDGLVASGLSFRVPNLDILLPVGISFYTFQALGYLIDVHRKDIQAERHFGIYALFVSFFPQLVAGPIERSSNLLPQFRVKNTFDYDRARSGMVLMLWGFFKKLVIADRAAILVNQVYKDPESFEGVYQIVALLFFAIQIYCDFSAYSDIARGASRIMGFKLMNNFDSPYSAFSITDFWRRWHISLSTWFRDYVYFPLGGNRNGEGRMYLNLFLVFLISGLWHGANITFVIWGALHGGYIVIERFIYRFRTTAYGQLNWSKEQWHYRMTHWIVTFCLVNLAWLFFRADTLTDASIVLSKIIHWETGSFSYVHLGEILGAKEDLNRLMIAIGILFLFESRIKLNVAYGWFLERSSLIRWSVYLLASLIILTYGVYGGEEKSFIYFQF